MNAMGFFRQSGINQKEGSVSYEHEVLKSKKKKKEKKCKRAPTQSLFLLLWEIKI